MFGWLKKSNATPDAARESVEQLHKFREAMLGVRSSWPVVQLGRRAFVERYIPEDEFYSLFGGYAARRFQGVEYIGVWSVRSASKMRRILRERGATFRLTSLVIPAS